MATTSEPHSDQPGSVGERLAEKLDMTDAQLNDMSQAELGEAAGRLDEVRAALDDAEADRG